MARLSNGRCRHFKIALQLIQWTAVAMFDSTRKINYLKHWICKNNFNEGNIAYMSRQCLCVNKSWLIFIIRHLAYNEMRAINLCSINLHLRLKHEPRAQHIYDTGTITATTEAYSDSRKWHIHNQKSYPGDTFTRNLLRVMIGITHWTARLYIEVVWVR